jgi:anti-sigma B factor antagonist
MSVNVEQETRDGKYVVKVSGEVDLYSSPDLRDALTNSKCETGLPVVVDLSEVSYMDSSGVATLVEGFRTAEDRKVGFVLAAPSQSVMKVLRLSRLDSVFEIRDQV